MASSFPISRAPDSKSAPPAGAEQTWNGAARERDDASTTTAAQRECRCDRLALAGVVVLGAIVTALLTWGAVLRRGEFYRLQVLTAATDIVADLEAEVRGATRFVDSLAGFFQSSEQVTEEEFHRFVAPPLAQMPELLTAEWQPFVAGARRQEFEEKIRAGGQPEFQIVERGADRAFVAAGERPFYLPVLYQYPDRAKTLPIGFDLASLPDAVATKWRSVDTAAAASTTLLSTTARSLDDVGHLVITRAVLASGQGPARDRVLGFASGIFRTDRMLELAVEGRNTHGLMVELHHHDAAGALLTSLRSSEVAGEPQEVKGFAFEHEIQLPGDAWLLRVVPEPMFFSGIMASLPWLALVLGAIGTAIGTAGARTWQNNRARRELAHRERLLGETKFHDVVDQMQGAMFLLAAVGGESELTVLDANAAAAALLGRDRAAIIGRRATEVWPCFGMAPFADGIRRAAGDGTGVRLPPFQCVPEAGAKWLDVLVFRLNSGEVGVVVNDFTPLKVAEEELRRARDELEVALDASRVGLWIWNPKDDAVRIDARCAAILGVATLDPVDAATVRARIHPDDVTGISQQFAAPEHRDYEFECRFSAGNGGWRWLSARCRRVFADDGALLRILGCVWDVTERRTLEGHLGRLQRLESIGTLAGGVAHNLNNALVPVTMGLSMLRRQSGDDPDIAPTLQAMSESAHRAANIVRQLLTFTRSHPGEAAPVNPQRVLEELRAMLTETFPARVKIALERSEAALPTLIADETQLRQVLLNLCVNASEAMPKGGRLTLDCTTATLGPEGLRDFPELKAGRYVVFHVTDTGSGIPARIRDRIFDPFFTTKAVGDGSGLGLSIASGIVRAYHGAIRFETVEGMGTRFSVYLAIRNEPAPAQVIPPNEPAHLTPATGSRCILIAEDEAPVRELARRVLERDGFQVIAVTNGQEAVAQFKERHGAIDLVLLDMMMPVMDGVAAAAEISRAAPQVPIVGASGITTGTSADEARRCGVQSFLPKPYTIESLLSTVHEALEAAAGKA